MNNHGKLSRILIISVLLIGIVLSLCACSSGTGTQQYDSLDDMRGKRIGVVTGAITGKMLESYYGEDVEISYFNSNSDMAQALDAGKVDGYVSGKMDADLFFRTYTDQRYLSEPLSLTPISFYFPKTDEGLALCEKMNEFIAKMSESGEMEELYKSWEDYDNDDHPLDTGLSGENGTLTMAFNSNIGRPQCYIRNGVAVGSDIEFAYKFCREYGYGLELTDYDFGGMLSAVKSSKVDFAGGGVCVTEERAESGYFSEPTHYNTFVMVVKKTASDMDESYTCTEDLRYKTVGALTGSITGPMLEERFGEDVNIAYFNSNADMAQALDAGKIDGYLACDIDAEIQSITYPDQYPVYPALAEIPIVYYLPSTDDGENLCGEINSFLAELEASGELSEIIEKWKSTNEDEKPLDTALSGENGTLTMACFSGIGIPQCYIRDGQIVGNEIEIMYLFCREHGYGLEFIDTDFGGMLASVKSGKADIAGSGLGVTEEREDAALFSDPTHINTFVITVKGQNSTGYNSLDELRNKKIACLTGGSTITTLDNYYEGEVEICCYNATADMAAALEAGKVDAYCADNMTCEKHCTLYEGHRMLTSPVSEHDVSFFFPKDDPEREVICRQMNEFICGLREDGTLDELKSLWYGDDNTLKVVDTELPEAKVTLTMACTSGIGYPFAYAKDGGYAGYDIDLAYRFCRAYGYGLKIMDSDFGGMISAVSSGKADFGGSHVPVTEANREVFLFSEPYDELSFNLVVKDGVSSGGGGFLSTFADSFKKTFIVEARWKLFLTGLGVTVLITVLSIVLGTLIGFAVYMACRSGNRVLIRITDSLMWIINGMPTVVLLMLLFYVIFGKSSLSGTWVAVIAFTLIFAVGVIAMLRQSVDSIDPGQLEAAYALGYGKTQAFTRRILPQAIYRLLPAYKAQTVTIIKSTAIVGYIAVQDLTKVGDIVRSRTFEAFFPIISTAVLYFLLAAVLSIIVKAIANGFDPKRRSREKILKGVEK